MAQATTELTGRVEAIARYLGAMFPAAGFERYEDANAIGFRFIGAPHASVEFERQWLALLPSNADSLAQELHLNRVCAEINDTPTTQRVIFGSAGVRRV